jgi:acetyl esterase/lipase
MKKIFLLACLMGMSLCILLTTGCSDNFGSDTTVTDPRSVTPPVTVKDDIIYGVAKDLNGVPDTLKLDLYFPPAYSPLRKYPLVMLIHGGAYYMGDKGDMKGNCKILADSGFIAASINYRMGWDHGVADCDGDPASRTVAAYRALQDANAAFRFLSAKADKFGIDTTWFFIGGQSAGSSIALNTSYITNAVAKIAFPDLYDTLGAVNTSGNPFTNKFQIKSICNMWGALPDSTLIRATNALPTISFHGTADTVVPYNYGYSDSCPNYPIVYGSLCIHRQLLRYNQPTITNLVIGGGHGPSAYHHDFLMGNTACFFRRIINGVYIRSRVDTTLVSSCN